MALLLPDSASEVINRSKTDVQRELPESNPFLPNSWLSALIVAFGNRIFDFYLQLKEAIKQTFFDTSTGTFLERQASWFGIIRLAATQAEGNIIATGTLASVIPISTSYQASNGIAYLTTAPATIVNTNTVINTLERSGSTVTVTINIGHNLSSNVAVTIAGADQTEYNGVQEAGVDAGELAGGTDQEDDDSLRERFLERIQNPVAQFNDAQITSTAKEINGVTRVFITDAFPEPGQVTIFFMRDNDLNPIPTAPEVTAVKNQILTIKPANTADVDVIVNAPTPVNVPFTFTALVPNTLTMQAAIDANLQQFFAEDTSVSIDIEEDAYRSAIFNTVDPDTSDVVRSFTLSTPTGDIAIANGEIGVFDGTTYPVIP